MHCVLIGRRILPCVGCVWTHSGTIDYIKWFNIKPNPLSIVISGLLLLVHIGYGIAILVTQGMVVLVVLVFSSSSASWSLQLVSPIPISSEAQKDHGQLKDANTNANLPWSFIALQGNYHALESLF